MTASESASLKCPCCGAAITLRALGQSVMVACPFCHSQIDVSQPGIRLIRRFNEQVRRLHVALGTRGTVQGQKFEVIGALGRSQGGYPWEEYLLFNPYVGFRWLVWDHGHWSVGQAIRDVAQIRLDFAAHYQGRSYRRFQHGQAVIEWVVGEFYWRVATGDRVEATDYVAPPFMLSREKSAAEVTWTLLEYLPPAQTAAAFGATPMPPAGIAPNQPNPAERAWRDIAGITIAAICLAILIQIGTVVAARRTAIPLGEYRFADSTHPAEQVFGPFYLPAAHSLNELTAQAPIADSWVELDCSLVNAATGASVDFLNAFEFYSGRDSDGPWSEGSRTGTALLASVPAGTYNLIVEGASGDAYGRRLATAVRLGLRHDVVPWRNFWLALALLLAYPAYLAYRRFAFEKERWSDADPSP